MKPVEIRAAAGVRNDLPPTRFGPTDLLVGDNIELDETGRVLRRLGVAQIDTSSYHSLWGDNLGAYCVKDGVLSAFDGVTCYPIQTVSGSRVRYERIVNKAFWTDGQQTGILRNNSSAQAGLPVPGTPILDLAVGDLKAGSYLVCITHMRKDGYESGASAVQRVEVPANGALELFLPPAPSGVYAVGVYVSECNGEVPMLATTLDATTGTFLYSDNALLSVVARTRFCGPPPAGQIIGYYKGRLYVADGQHLWYSLPYEYELFDLSSGYVSFTSDVRTFAPVADGIFIGTEESIVFLAGDDPATFDHRLCASYGAVLGTETRVPTLYLPEGSTDGSWMWASKRGMCIGSSGGVFSDLTGKRYRLPAASSGASLFKTRGETPHVITSLFA